MKQDMQVKSKMGYDDDGYDELHERCWFEEEPDEGLKERMKTKIVLNKLCPICKKEIILGQEIANTKKGKYHLECYLKEKQEEQISILVDESDEEKEEVKDCYKSKLEQDFFEKEDLKETGK